MAARAKVPPPCGCQYPKWRGKFWKRHHPNGARDWCQQPGALWRAVLAQVDLTRARGRALLVCGYHRAYMTRRGEIISSERVT